MARRLLLLNGLATLGVVLNHAASWVFTGMFWWADRYRDVAVPNFDLIGSPAYFVIRFLEQLIAFTVPSFLAVSGFFIAFVAGREPVSTRWTQAGKRVWSLLIPYAVWTTVILAERALTGTRYSISRYAVIYLVGGASPPYYYVPLLAQCLLLSPLIIEWGKRHWFSLLLVTGGVQLGVLSTWYLVYLGWHGPVVDAVVAATTGWYLPGRIFWFVAGVVTALHLEGCQQHLARYRAVYLSAAVLLLLAGMVEWETLRRYSTLDWVPYYDTALDSLYAASAVCAIVAFSHLAPRSIEGLQTLGRYSYGVYLLHSIVLEYAARAAAKLVPGLLAQPVVFLAYLFALGLGLPLLMMRMVRESKLRAAYPYLFG